MIPGSERARAKQTRFAVLCCGSRDWSNRALVLSRLRTYPPGTLVLHGGWEGADALAHACALELGHHPWPIFYLFEHGRAGGPRRNACMLEILLLLHRHGYAISVEAFDLGGRGTADMCSRAEKAGVRLMTSRP